MKGLVDDNLTRCEEFDREERAKRTKVPVKSVSKKLAIKAICFLEEKKLLS